MGRSPDSWRTDALQANGLYGAKARQQGDLVLTTAVTATDQPAQRGREQEADREGRGDVGHQDLQ